MDRRRHLALRPSLFLLALLASMAPLYALSQPSTRVQPAKVKVVVSGLRNSKGQVSCALFRSADGFPKDANKAVAHQEVRIASARATCSFEEVPPGRYAVAVFHDENGNGKMDTNLVGMPREGVGASNNPKTRLGPPKFADAAFSVAGSEVDLQITLRYL
jgi:uncharacterized protein (DUF2141 family)